MTLVILLVIALGLFGLAFLTKRRYGVLGLGLTAGLVLSQQMSKEVAGFLQYVDFPVEPLAFTTAASVALILGPAFALLIAGPKYKDQHLAIIGSVAFAIYGTMLLLAPLTTNLPLTDSSIQPALSQIALNSPLIITAGVIAAVVDTMYSHGKSALSKKGKH